MSILEDWYGESRAARMRQAMPHVPSQVTVDSFGETRLELSVADKLIALAKMDSVILSLKVGLAKARATVAIRPTPMTVAFLLPLAIPLTTPSEVKANILNGLNQISNQIELFLVSRKQDVLDGKLELSRWLNNAEIQRQGIDSILRGLDEDSTASNMRVTIADAKRDLEALWGKLKLAVPIVGGLGVIIAIAIGAFLLLPYFAAARQLSAYTPRRHRKRLKRLRV